MRKNSPLVLFWIHLANSLCLIFKLLQPPIKQYLKPIVLKQLRMLRKSVRFQEYKWQTYTIQVHYDVLIAKQ